MYKNFNITEEEKKQILESHQSYGYKKPISEQSEERNFIRAVQTFLNSKKIYGSKNVPLIVDGKTDNNLTSQTSQAISKYQSSIGVSPSDGVWGENTWNKMPKEDEKKLKNFMAQEGGLFDKFLNKIGLY